MLLCCAMKNPSCSSNVLSSSSNSVPTTLKQADTLQLLGVNSLRSRGKQIFHPHPQTTLSDIA
jgi:hypothetical protein